MRKSDPIEEFLLSDVDGWLRDAVALLASPRRERLPILLNLVCTHPETPNWLKDAIWDAVNSHTIETPDFSEHWFHRRLVINGEDYPRQEQQHTAESVQ